MKKLYFLMMMAATLFVLGCGGGDDSDDDVWGGSGNDLKDKWFVCVPPSDKISEIAQWVNQDIDYGYTESSEYFDSTGKLDHPGGRVFWFESTYGNGQVVALHIIDDHTMEGYINGGTFQLGNTSSFELKKYLLYAMDMGSFLGKLGFYSSHLAYYNYDKINNQIFVYMLPGTFTISGNDLLMDGGGRWVGVNPKKVYTSTTATIKNVSAEVLSIGNSTVNFGYEGGEKNITVSANIEWKIESNTASSWLTVTKVADNTLQLVATENPEHQSRSGKITIKGISKTTEITVTQEKVKEYLHVSEGTVDFLPEGEIRYLTVTTNLSGWSVKRNEVSSWLNVVKENDSTLKLEASMNNTGQERSGSVYLDGWDWGLYLIKVSQPSYNNPNATTITVKGVSFNMVRVDGGTFTMGLHSDFERPIKSVTLNEFYIGETEVTQALWFAVMGKRPTTDAEHQWSSEYGLGDNYPAYFVDWGDCQEFITKLNSLTGKKFRFPTEAEWEYAASGGTKSRGYKFSGSNSVNDVAWYSDNSNRLVHEVAMKLPNELGLYDMSGNVHEWCSDKYSDNSYVLRGGGWSDSDHFCAISDRVGGITGSRDYRYDTGLRLAMD